MTDQTAAARPAAPHRVRFACDSDMIDNLVPMDFVRTYSDLVPDTTALARLQARFPDSVLELIDRGLGDPTGLANIFDIEPGALSPDEAAGRARAKHAAGMDWLVAYSDRNDLDAVAAAFGAAGTGFWRWVAAPGELQLPSHPGAQVQFAGQNDLGWHMDLTIVWDPAYRPAAAHAAAAVPAQAAAAATSSAGGSTPAAAAAPQPAPVTADDAAWLADALSAAKTVHGGLAMVEHDLAALTGMIAGKVTPEAFAAALATL